MTRLSPSVSLVSLGSLVSLVSLGCVARTPSTYGPNKVEIPVEDPMPAARSRVTSGQLAPPSGTAKESPFPAVSRVKLANGMDVVVVSAHTLPIVQIRVVVHAGAGSGSSPAIAMLTGDLAKDGGAGAMSSAELLRRVETLGSNLGVRTDFDATVLSLAVTKEQLGEGLGLVAQMVREPRFDGEELKKLKARAVDEAADAARSSGAFMATRLVHRELFPEKSAYATYQSVPSEIAKVDGAAIQAFHRRFYVPKGTTLVLAGDLDATSAKALAERHFGSWTGAAPPKLETAPPRLPTRTRVLVAHRPKSVQSDVYVAMLAPPRRADEWASARLANQILGGGVASRLFADVREQRSLAYRTSAQVLELGHGEQPLVVYAGTETAKTTQAVVGLLENVNRMTSSPPSSSEVEGARRYLSDVFAIRMETIGSIADLVVIQETFGLPDGYWDAYRARIRATEPAAVEAAARKLYSSANALIVVAGDGDVIGPQLARFGDVTIVDPEKEFTTMRTIPQETK